MPNSDINIDCENWFSAFTCGLDRHAPVETRRVKSKRLPDWLTQEILDTRKLRANSKKLQNRSDYKKYHNKTNVLIQNAKHQYFSDSIIKRKAFDEDRKPLLAKHYYKLVSSTYG